MRQRSSILACVVALLFAGALAAGTEGRIAGEIQDAQGKPIADARVTLMAQEVRLARTTESNKKGKFTLIVADATKSYLIRIEKDGYQPIQEAIKVPVGGLIRKSWTLAPGEGAIGAAVVEAVDPAAKVYNEGAQAFNTGELDTALAKFQEAAELKPELAEAWQGIMMIHWGQERTQEAVSAAEKLVALDPENVFALRVLHDGYDEFGDERSAQVLDTLVEVDRTEGTARRVFNVGVAAVRANDADTAIRRFEQALEIDPTLAPAYRVLGQIHNSLSDYPAAIASAQKLLELEPGSPEAHGILYQAYRATGDSAKAQESLQILQSANPEELARAMFDEGQTNFNAGNLEQAKSTFEQLLSVQPEHAAAHYMLGLCYLNTGNQTRAKQLLQRFLELAPEHPEAGAAREMLQYLE